MRPFRFIQHRLINSLPKWHIKRFLCTDIQMEQARRCFIRFMSYILDLMFYVLFVKFRLFQTFSDLPYLPSLRLHAFRHSNFRFILIILALNI